MNLRPRLPFAVSALSVCCALFAATLWAAEDPEAPVVDEQQPAQQQAQPIDGPAADKRAVDTGAIDQADLPLPLDEIRIFAQVLNQIRKAYVEPIDDKTLLENAIKGMLAGIDPHSSYLVDDDYSELQESTTGEFGGLGVEVSIENGLIKIIAPMDDSPAARAGIKAGDVIIKLDDTPTGDVTLGDTSELLRGEPGTDITLTILREGAAEPLEITVTREIIKTRSIRYRSLEPGYGYVRISQFSANTGDEVVDALAKLEAENKQLKGLVMDLRNNPGGVLQSAVKVVDSFVTDGRIVYTKGRVEGADMSFDADAEDPSHGVPLVVLIDGGSASASEIVAGALQDLHRAIILGTKSFGKGSVQTVLPLAEDRAIKLTTALYYTPSGRSIQARGIEPDIIVNRGQVTRIPDSITSYREADLSRHLETSSTDGNTDAEGAVQEGAAPVAQPAAAPDPKDVLVEDYQLHEALNVLKGLNIVQSRR
jgi:carboxyl-terminal processing protease